MGNSTLKILCTYIWNIIQRESQHCAKISIGFISDFTQRRQPQSSVYEGRLNNDHTCSRPWNNKPYASQWLYVIFRHELCMIQKPLQYLFLNTDLCNQNIVRRSPTQPALFKEHTLSRQQQEVIFVQYRTFRAQLFRLNYNFKGPVCRDLVASNSKKAYCRQSSCQSLFSDVPLDLPSFSHLLWCQAEITKPWAWPPPYKWTCSWCKY